MNCRVKERLEVAFDAARRAIGNNSRCSSCISKDSVSG
jgi:hypothetical protein